MNLKTIYIALALAAAPSAGAEVHLPRIFSPGMVVQRDAEVRLHGTAEPGEAVNVLVRDSRGRAVGPRKGYTTTADGAGEWSVSLAALRAGGPYTITVNDITLDDVLSGDVFFCSGQSNMELPVRRVMEKYADEVNAYSNAQVRHFNTPQEVEYGEQRGDVNGGSWQSVTPETAQSMSAIAYFMAKELNSRTGVPVGIINSSWGGTPIEAWMSEAALAGWPRALSMKRQYADPAYRDAVKAVEGQNYMHWNMALDSGDPGLTGAVKWYADGLDDSAWAEVSPLYTADWNTDGLNAVNGSHWLRKDIELDADAAGAEGVLRLGCVVDADSVYVNGRLVGSTTYMYPPRIYRVPAGVLRAGRNNITVRVISQHGRGGLVPDKELSLTAAGRKYMIAGDWRYRRGSVTDAGPGMQFWHYSPTVLYASMVAPYRGLALAGVVWYQGESNVGRRNEYAGLLTSMIADWRETLGNDGLPFYIVELADFLHPSDTGGRAAWAEMRAQQARVAETVPGATLIRNSDLGEWNDIHPLDKKTPGCRVADAITATMKSK